MGLQILREHGPSLMKLIHSAYVVFYASPCHNLASHSFEKLTEN